MSFEAWRDVNGERFSLGVRVWFYGRLYGGAELHLGRRLYRCRWVKGKRARTRRP